MEKINHNELFFGQLVQDSMRNIGTIQEFHDVHNVLVEYKKGGIGFYCLLENCEETKDINGEKIPLQHYDPLYKVD